MKIIASQIFTNHSFWTFYIGGKPVFYIINGKIHGCLEIPDLLLVLNMIFLTREISCSTLEINLVPMYYSLFNPFYTHVVSLFATEFSIQMLYVLYKPRNSRQKFCVNLRVYHILYKDSFTTVISFVFCPGIINTFLN